MKKLLFILVLTTLVSVGLVSCKQDTVKLHPSVGDIYGSATSTMGGDGIIFYVDEANGYALVCSMNNLMRDRQTNEKLNHMWESNFTWSVFGSDTVMERDTIWANVYRKIRQYEGVTTVDSAIEGSMMPDKETFKKYNFKYKEEDSLVKIYPMLRYKAYREKGEPVHPTITKPTLILGYLGVELPVDTLLESVTVEKIIGDDTWKADSVLIGGKRYGVTLNGKCDYRNDENGNRITLYRPYSDTVERRTRTYKFLPVRYVDTMLSAVKAGDRIKLDGNNKGEYALDTNYSVSLVPGLGENDPDGKVNTDKIRKQDVPCRQQLTPDSSSAARTCYEYFTKKYDKKRANFAADTTMRDVTYANEETRWYLPSRDELKRLFDAKDKINEKNKDIKGFEPLENCYWSSNQRDSRNAWYKCFSDNGVESYIPKANNNYRVGIRAVRKVKWPLK